MTPLSFHRIFNMMGLKHSPRFIHTFKLLGASFGPSMIDIFQEIPHLPHPKTCTGAVVLPHKDTLDTFCIDLIYQVKQITLATTPAPLILFYKYISFQNLFPSDPPSPSSPTSLTLTRPNYPTAYQSFSLAHSLFRKKKIILLFPLLSFILLISLHRNSI